MSLAFYGIIILKSDNISPVFYTIIVRTLLFSMRSAWETDLLYQFTMMGVCSSAIVGEIGGIVIMLKSSCTMMVIM